MKKKRRSKKWIAGAIKHKGALHRQLGIPEGTEIPEGFLKKAEHAVGVLGRRARLAETLKKLPRHHGPRKKKRRRARK